MAFGKIRSKKPDPDDVPPPPPPNMFDPDVIEAADEDVQVRAFQYGAICWRLAYFDSFFAWLKVKVARKNLTFYFRCISYSFTEIQGEGLAGGNRQGLQQGYRRDWVELQKEVVHPRRPPLGRRHRCRRRRRCHGRQGQLRQWECRLVNHGKRFHRR